MYVQQVTRLEVANISTCGQHDMSQKEVSQIHDVTSYHFQATLDS